MSLKTVEEMATDELEAEFKSLAVDLQPNTTRRADISRELNTRLVSVAATLSINALDQNEKEALYIVLKEAMGK